MEKILKRSRTNTVRLQKFLADAGLASRRTCEEWILKGWIKVNGRVEQVLGTKVDLHKDRVQCKGRLVRQADKVYYALHKPRGYICTNKDPQGRKRAIDLIRKKKQKVFTIGRLDVTSEGLILVTNDGAFAQRVIHPSKNIEKEYIVRVDKPMEPADQLRLMAGMTLRDGVFRCKKLHVSESDKDQIQLVIHMGRNRVIRRAFQKLGYHVKNLKRIRIGRLKLKNLKPGDYRSLTSDEINFFES